MCTCAPVLRNNQEKSKKERTTRSRINLDFHDSETPDNGSMVDILLVMRSRQLPDASM